MDEATKSDLWNDENELASELRKFFTYDKKSGVIQHRKTRRSISIKPDAGGYLRLSFRGKQVFAHRAAWLIANGPFPPGKPQVDHINGKRDDNRLKNLRAVSTSENLRNQSCNVRSNTGIRGVSLVGGKYLTLIGYKKKSIFLGRFDSLIDAAKARSDAEIRYNFRNAKTTSTARNFLLSNNQKSSRSVDWMRGLLSWYVSEITGSSASKKENIKCCNL